MSYFLPMKFKHIFYYNITKWSVLWLTPRAFSHFSIVYYLRERSRGSLTKDYETFILMIFLEPRLYNKCIWINITVSIIFFSESALHHRYFVECTFELLLLIFIEGNVFDYHIVLSTLHPAYQKLHSKVVGICHWSLNFEFISLFNQEILCWVIYFEGVINNSWTSVVVESLKYKLIFTAFFVKQVSIEFHIRIFKEIILGGVSWSSWISE